MEAAACRLAHQVQCVSHSLRDDVIRRRLVAPKRCIVLGNGSSNGVDAESKFNPGRIPFNMRSELRQTLGIPAEATVVGFVGRLSRDKGIAELATAWSLVAEQQPTTYLLVLGPIDGADRETNRAIRSLQAAPRVRVLHEFRESAPYYLAMDLLVLPSYREGFPNVTLEAAAMSLPVVTTDAVGCRDAVLDGVTGRLVPVGSAAELASAIQSYVANPELRHRHGVAGRARVLRDYVPRDVWDHQLKLFTRLLESRGIAAPRHRDPIVPSDTSK
jgi:glycosyltransferase involved in cell wall biosynthesis